MADEPDIKAGRLSPAAYARDFAGVAPPLDRETAG